MLYVLRELARREPASVADILASPADIAIPTLDSVSMRVHGFAAFLATLRTGALPLRNADEFLRIINSPHRPEFGCIPVPGEQMHCLTGGTVPDELREIAQGSELVNDPSRVVDALESGLALLRDVWPEVYSTVSTVVDLCIGLEGPRGHTRSFSNVNLPGLAIISINNPPALIAEQLVQEATKLKLALMIEEDGQLAEYLSSLPACHSPFTGSVTTAERVLHRVTSYARVDRFWNSLLGHRERLSDWLEREPAMCIPFIFARISESRGLVQLGWAALNMCLTEDEAVSTEDIFIRVVGSSPSTHAEPLTPTNEFPDALFPPIQRAEILLARSGAKSSRISVGTRDQRTQMALLRSGVPHCYSSLAFTSANEARLENFSNTFLESCNVLDAEAGHESLCYLADSPERARRAMELDAHEVAGEVFGIPDCCIAFFRRSWPSVRSRGGDLFAELLGRQEKQSSTIPIRWQCNAAAMYFSGGLCWHFPCGLHCENTANLITNRLAELSLLDGEAAADLMQTQKRPFVWSCTEGYGLLPAAGGPETELATLRWSAKEPVNSSASTVSDLLSSGGWLLLIPE